MQCELCPQNLTDSAGKLIPGLVVVDVLGMFQQHSQYAVPAFVILFCAEIIFCYIRILCDVYGVPLPTFSFGGENAGINSKYARWAFFHLKIRTAAGGWCADWVERGDSLHLVDVSSIRMTLHQCLKLRRPISSPRLRWSRRHWSRRRHRCTSSLRRLAQSAGCAQRRLFRDHRCCSHGPSERRHSTAGSVAQWIWPRSCWSRPFPARRRQAGGSSRSCRSFRSFLRRGLPAQDFSGARLDHMLQRPARRESDISCRILFLFEYVSVDHRQNTLVLREW